MRSLARIALLLGAALAGAGATFLHAQPPDPETQRILVAENELRSGHRLTHDDMGWVEWPKNALPKGAFTSVEALFGAEGEEGDAEPRITLRTTRRGEPLVQSKISGFGTSTRLAAQLAEGMRAFTVPTSETGGGGFINPGDRVDVILTGTEDGELLSKVIMQDAPVIAVDRNLGEERARSGRSEATIEVTRTQAQQLLLAQRVGKLLLMLRGVHASMSEEIKLVDTSAFDFSLDEPKVDAPRMFERPLCYAFNPQAENVWKRCGSPDNRSRGRQRVEDSPAMLERKRRELEEEQRRVAAELKRLEEQSSTAGD